MSRKYVVQVKDVTALHYWQDDALPGMRYEFEHYGEAREAVKVRKRLSPDFDFRVVTRDEDEPKDVLYTS